jgi:hypothetical protein
MKAHFSFIGVSFRRPLKAAVAQLRQLAVFIAAFISVAAPVVIIGTALYALTR